MKEFADHTNRFDGKGEVYAKGRPRYADGLFAYMRDTLPITTGRTGGHRFRHGDIYPTAAGLRLQGLCGGAEPRYAGKGGREAVPQQELYIGRRKRQPYGTS